MTALRDSVLALFEGILTFFHDLFEPLFGAHSWGWAIVALTVVVRIFLLPLAIKQTRSMRAMQKLQPHMKELQKKYKVDRELMRKDPELYRSRRQKLNEEMMSLYRREGANPAASCLPLLAQAPIFLALFWTLRWADELIGQPFYFFTSVGNVGLDGNVSDAGWPGWLLIVLMSGTMFWSMRQTMARTTMQADNPMAQQQKIMMYAMPVVLAVVSFQFPLGILLYWVTTNTWQVAQQAIILREVRSETNESTVEPGPTPPRRISPGASSGTKAVTAVADEPSDEESAEESGKDSEKRDRAAKKKSKEASSPNESTRRDHLPRRRASDD